MFSKRLLLKSYTIVLAVFFTSHLYGQFGPGGVGNTSGTSSLKAWYMSSFGVSTTGTLVNSLTNRAGIAALNLSETGTNRPTLVANAVNGYSELSFSGTNKLTTGLTLTTSNFVTDQATTFLVSRADNTTQTSCVYTTDPLTTDRFTNHVPWGGTVYNDIGTCCGTNARLEVSGLANLNTYSVWSYVASASAGKEMYRNGVNLQNRAGTSTYSGHASQRFNMGGFTSGTNGFQGDVTEMIVYNAPLNTTQRIIVENYLAAKYGLASAANDLYVQDNPVNGNFDHDVAGIGRLSASDLHNDSQGTGIVRIIGGAGLGNNEFLFWGHNNQPIGTWLSTDFPAIVQGRWFRTWRVNEVNSAGTPIDVGAVDIRFDLTGFGAITASDLRLLVDTDNDGVFSDELPIGGATSIGANVYQFSGVTALSNNVRFTLGTVNVIQTPLPIELLSFTAEWNAENDAVLQWTTASEINNDYFQVDRSADGTNWEVLGRIEGVGNSTSLQKYLFVDEHPTFGISYYRLTQIDLDGQQTTYAIRSLQNDSHADVVIFPNPTNNLVNVTGEALKIDELFLFDLFGKDVTSQIVVQENGVSTLTLTLGALAKGVYFLKTKSQTLRIVYQ